jgi:hypothetical protein
MYSKTIKSEENMTYHFVIGKESMLKTWKEVRLSLNENLTDKEHLYIVTKFWSLAPLRSRVTDWDSPQLWDDPWKLIYTGNFDESSLAIAMYYTLLFAHDPRWTSDRLQLMLVKDQSRALQRIILEVDTRWLMNLEHNTVLDKTKLKEDLWIQQRYQYNGKNHLITP